MSLRYILESIEVLVGCRYVYSAAPSAGTIVIEAARVRDVGSVDIQLVIVESLVLRGGFADPVPFGIFYKVIFDCAYVQFDLFCIRSINFDTHATL